MRRSLYMLIIIVLAGGAALAVYSPDVLSLLFVLLMAVTIVVAVLGGILPVLHYEAALERGLDGIERAMEVQSSSAWSSIRSDDDFFGQRVLDEAFDEYRSKVNSQQQNGQVLSDITDYVNEDMLSLHSWQTLVSQVPGMLTSLGILGTFIGLLVGIRGIGFSTVNDALTSVQTLLSGIQIAFYTSIAGVILSLIFNILYRSAWNTMLRSLGLFVDSFHKNIIPTVEEQKLYRERREFGEVTQLLDRIPKTPAFSAAGPEAAASAGGEHEKILMPQILEGLQKEEFTFQLQPRFDINTRKMVGAEALVRWNHGKMGEVLPSVFIPILEKNGYITKLDQYVWEKVCQTLRGWIDAGLRPVPVSINVTKTDVLAMDVKECFTKLAQKYKIPPRYLEIEIAENAYLNASDSVQALENSMRAEGFRVIMDGFNGDFVLLKDADRIYADAIKLDLRRMEGKTNAGAIAEVFEQARKMKFNLSAEGIESMEQLSALRKAGCSEGQGFFLSKPMSIQEFENLTSGGKTR